MRDSIVLSNGDQTDTICESLLSGHSLQYAMSTRCYDRTRRTIRRVSRARAPTGAIRSHCEKGGDAPDCRRKYWSYDPKEGAAHLICTMTGTAIPLPSFSGERSNWRRGNAGELTRHLERAGRGEPRFALRALYRP
jgi:hypothetical protein